MTRTTRPPRPPNSSNRQLVRKNARKAVELASKAAFDVHENRPTLGSFDLSVPESHASSQMSQSSHSTFKSFKKAMLRGSKLGARERKDSISKKELIVPRINRLHSFESNGSDTALTDPRTTSPLSGTSGKRTLLPKRTRKENRESQNKQSKGKNSQVWMCGVCQRNFNSFDDAEKHESYHIQEVVTDLGWSIYSPQSYSNGPSPRNQNFWRGETMQQLEQKVPKTPEMNRHSQSNHPPHPDTLRMSSSRIPSTTTSLPLPKAMSPIFESDMSDVESFIDSDMVSFILADEALVDVCDKAEPLILTNAELQAESEIEWLTNDKAYYDLLQNRWQHRKGGRTQIYRKEGKSTINKVQNKFVDAYHLMKEGKSKIRGSTKMDYYTSKVKGDAENKIIIDHTKNTFYVNVMVKNSIKVVRHELERLAKQRWEDSQRPAKDEIDIQRRRFQKFRSFAQDNLVKLAGYALASDFTPRRIAVQLSNDLYRLLSPRLKRRGVDIETEIEYRVGPYFVLAVNVRRVHWRRLVRVASRDAVESRNLEIQRDSGIKGSSVILSFVQSCLRLAKLTRFEVLAQFLAWMYLFHWMIYTPICFFLYVLFPKTFRTYFLQGVADEIFNYVEQKGMQMDIDIRDGSTQAAFMLSALREMRADGREKKLQQDGEAAAKIVILGPLLGPAIKGDKNVALPPPHGFIIPPNLDFVGLELDLPVGFKRLRWAFLSSQSSFLPEAVFRSQAKYENIVEGKWSKFSEVIGLPSLPDGIDESEFIGTERETSYLMPKSAFVKANMCYETAYIEAYNDFCFCLKKKTLTPEVPYGSTFIAWTKFVILNTGKDSCKMICSLEAEFPNGPPLVSRQIQSGMKAGVGELFVKIGETITHYADEYP